MEVNLSERNHHSVKEDIGEDVEMIPTTIATVPRDLWTNKIEFLLSVIGYVVDLGKDLIEFSTEEFFDISQAMFGDFRTNVIKMVVELFSSPT